MADEKNINIDDDAIQADQNLEENAEAVADDTGKLPGRGAYICPEKACVENERKRKALERSFKTRIDPVSYERLKEAVERFGTG